MDRNQFIKMLRNVGYNEDQITQQLTRFDEEQGKKSGLAADANAGPSNTASDSEGGLLESQSWGNLLNTGLKSLTKYTRFGGGDKTAVAEPEIQEKKEDVKQSAEYTNQSNNLKEELSKAFGDSPTLFGQIIENPSDLSLRDMQTSSTGSPEEYLLDLLKNQIGKSITIPGKFGDINVGKSLKDQTMYPALDSGMMITRQNQLKAILVLT